MSIAPETKDKVIFSISFLTILLTISISGYKDLLSNINLSMLSIPFSLFDLLFWSSVFLFTSVYFNALYNCSEIEIKIPKIMLKIPKMKLFEGFEDIADLLYIFAIFILPVLFTLSYFLSFCLYLLSTILNFIKIKLIYIALKHAENPTNNPLGPALGKVGAGATYLAKFVDIFGPIIIIICLLFVALYLFKITIKTIKRKRQK